ncbi:MAG: ATP-binding protein [Pseudomonadota bacterium]
MTNTSTMESDQTLPAATPVAASGGVCVPSSASAAEALTAITSSDDALMALPSGVIVVDDRGKVRLANPAALDMLAGPVEDTLWRDIVGRSFVLQANPSGNDLALTDGRRVRIETCPLESRRGQLLVLHDVTELAKLKTQLKRQERLSALGEVSASLAHQIRTPLSVAMLYASRMQKPEAELRTNAAKRLKRSLDDIESLVRDLLMFVRGEVLDARPVSVDALLAQVDEALREHLSGTGSTLQIHQPAAGSSVNGNPDALASVIQNLVLNSVQAKASEIEILTRSEAGPSGTELVLTLRDNGPGIPDGVRSHVFDPFFTTRGNGTGLGLAVARNVFETHGGSIELMETFSGCTFELRLPLGGDRDAIQPGPIIETAA